MRQATHVLIITLFMTLGQAQDNSVKKINKINFIGVNSLTEKQVQDVLRIHEPRFLSTMTFDHRLVKLDAINIKTLYVSEGFLGVTVKDSVEILPDIANVYFIINEGKRYFIKSITIEGTQALTESNILNILGLKSGEVYNPVRTNLNFHLLENRYHEIGKLFASIKISDSIGDSVDIFVSIDEGADVYINDASIEGLGNIDSKIVQRELLFKNGDKYNQSDITNSQRQLLQTGIFSVANIIPTKHTNNDSLVNMLIELRKFKQFEWISEGGYYPIEFYEGTEPVLGAGLLVEWRNRSLFQTATNLSLKLSGQSLISNNTINPKVRFDISFANSWLYKMKIPTKAQLYFEIFKDYLSDGAYVTRYGVDLKNTYYLKKTNRRSFIETRLNLDRFSRENIVSMAQSNPQDFINITQDIGEINVEKHSFQINFRVDRSDNMLYPTKGFMCLGQINSTGGILGGNRDFLKLDLGFRVYQPIYKSIILGSRVKFGVIRGWDENYIDYLYDKFYLGGGNSLRGWDILRYRTDADNLPSGSIVRILNNWEIRFPLFWYFGGEIFLDGGHIYDSYKSLSLSDLQWNSGFGITLATPLGPVRLDAARQLEEKSGWKIHLGVQYIF